MMSGTRRLEVVAFEGELDLDREADMEAAVDHALAAGPDAIHIDLTGVTFIDSSGLRALCAAHRQAEATGVELTILGPRPRIVKLFEITGLDQLFRIEPAEG